MQTPTRFSPGASTQLPACSFGNVYFGVWQKSVDCEVDVAVKARTLLPIVPLICISVVLQ